MSITKTPASILQEMMVKRGTVPNYELIHNGGGTHQNTFIYQVTCDGYTATGTGRCKKSARHEAATAMLETIAKHNAFPQLPASPAQSPVRTPLPVEPPVYPKSPANVPFRNTVGELQDLCITNNLGDPQYKETCDIGPPHARIFTIQCMVSSFVEEGTAKTKKQAKHEAARRMVNRITDFITDGLPNNLFNNSDEVIKANEDAEQAYTKAALKNYTELSDRYKAEAAKFKVNWGLKMVDYHKSFKEHFVEETKNEFLNKLEHLSSSVKMYKTNYDEKVVTHIKEEFESMLESLDIKYYKNHFEISNEKEPLCLVGIRINTAPDIYEIAPGQTGEEALIHAFGSVFDTMKLLLQ